jgi:hypothetical protein
MAKRTRDLKIHIWVRTPLLKKFSRLADKLGLSRDGALEQAMLLFMAETETK